MADSFWSPGRYWSRWHQPCNALVAGLVSLCMIVLPAADATATQFGPAQYWQHIGYSFEPCTSIVFRPNVVDSREPATMRRIIAEAVAVWNGAIGQAVLEVGPDTTASPDRHLDGINTLRVETTSTGGFGGVGGPTSATVGGRSRIVEADVEIYDFDGMALDAFVENLLLLTVIHEIGHALGFLHTIDPDSPMSYVARHGATMDVDTASVVRRLLAAPCGSHPTATNPVDLAAAFGRDKRVDFDHVSRIVQPLLDDEITTVVEAGVALAHLRIDEGQPLRRAVVCRDDVFADCLAGSSLAGPDGIVLYVPGGPDGALPLLVKDVLRRAFDGAPGDVFVVGGEKAVSPAVQQGLRDEGHAVQRVSDTSANPDRHGTAVAIAGVLLQRTGDASRVFVARGDNPADAMTAGVVGARDGRPILLTTPASLHPKSREFLASLRPDRIDILGGPAAVSEAAEKELQATATEVVRARGTDRSATSVAIARDLLGYRTITRDAAPITLLDGRDPEAWALAIAFAPLGAATGSPILLTESDGFLPLTPASPGNAPASGRFLAELDLDPAHDGSASGGPEAFFQMLGTENGRWTPLQALRYADQILLFCRWYGDDCRQQ